MHPSFRLSKFWLCFLFSQFNPKSSILMINNTNIRLKNILIWSYFFVNQEVILSHFYTLYIVLRYLFIDVVVKFEFKFPFKNWDLTEIIVYLTFLVMPPFKVKVFGRSFYFNWIYQTICQTKFQIIFNMHLFHQESQYLQQWRLDINIYCFNTDPIIAEIKFMSLLKINFTLLYQRNHLNRLFTIL